MEVNEVKMIIIFLILFKTVLILKIISRYKEICFLLSCSL